MKNLFNKSNFKLIENIINKYGIIIEFMLSLIFLIISYKIIYLKTYMSVVSYSYIIIDVILFVIILSLILIQTKKFHNVFEKLFLIYVIPIGLAFLIYVLPGFVPDETAHIIRAYDISNGNIMTKINKEMGNGEISIPSYYFPENATKVNNSYKTMYESFSDKTEYEKTNVASLGAESYSATLYILQSIVFFFAKVFNMNFFLAIYLARIANFILFLVCGYYAIKIIPFGKLVLFVTLFTPMMLHQAMSVSADSVINSLIILFIAYNFYLFKTDVKLTKRKIGIYYLLAIFLGTAKIVYFPIIFLSLLIFNKKSISNKRKWTFVLTVCGFVILIASIFYLISNEYKDIRPVLLSRNVNASEQIKQIINEPINYIGVIIETLTTNGKIYMQELIGYKLGYLDIYVNSFCIWTYMVIIVISLFCNKEKVNLFLKEKFLLIAIFSSSLVLVLTGLYLVWSDVGDYIIRGIQGRYFIPIALLILLCFKSKKAYIKSDKIIYVLLFLICIIDVSAIFSIINYFLV